MKRVAPLYIITAAILWSLDGVLRRELYVIPPAFLVMLEHLVGLVILLPFLPVLIKEYRKMNLREWGIMIAVSTIGGVMGTIFYTAALSQVNYIKYTVVVLLQQTQPIFAILLARAFLKETITKRYIVLVFIGLVSAYFLSFPDYKPAYIQKDQLIPAILALCAAISWGSATVLSKLILNRISFLAATAMRFFIVVPVALCAAISLGQLYPLADVSLRQWEYLVFIAFSTGAVACILYYKGLQYTPAKISTILEMAYPASALFIGYFFLQERLTWIQTISGVVLVAVIFTIALLKESPQQSQES